jgi:hypothetical protein
VLTSPPAVAVLRARHTAQQQQVQDCEPANTSAQQQQQQQHTLKGILHTIFSSKRAQDAKVCAQDARARLLLVSVSACARRRAVLSMLRPSSACLAATASGSVHAAVCLSVCLFAYISV